MRPYPPRVCISRCASFFSAASGISGSRASIAEPLFGAAVGALRTTPSNQLRAARRGLAPARSGRRRSVPALRIEAQQPHAVGGQPAAIAVGAERLRRRRDDAERRAVGQREAFGRRRARSPSGSDRRRSAPPSARSISRATPTASRRPPGRAADVHVLDEADLGADAARVLDQVDQLVVVDAAHDDGVELQRRRSRRAAAASMPASTAACSSNRVSARKRSACSVSRLTVMRCRPARRRRRGLPASSTPLVVSARSRDRRLRRERCDQRRQVAAQQRLAAGDADPVDADVDEGVGERRDLLEREQRLARQPDVVRLRHAVLAAQVAAVGDRDAQAAQRPAEAIARSGHR